MQSEKNSVTEYNKTVQKSHNFSITKILREINFGILNVSNLPFLQFFENLKFYQITKIRASENAKTGSFAPYKIPKIDFT